MEQCPESKQTAYYPAARCNLNDKPCVLELGWNCPYYEDYLVEIKKETEEEKEVKRKMKCPQKKRVKQTGMGDTIEEFMDCIGGRCAVWDENSLCCGERTKRRQLEYIADVLAKIAKELTLISRQEYKRSK